MQHYQFCTGALSQEEALRAAVATWPADVRPIVHWSESPPEEVPAASLPLLCTTARALHVLHPATTCFIPPERLQSVLSVGFWKAQQPPPICFSNAERQCLVVQLGKKPHAHSDYVGQHGPMVLYGLERDVDVMVRSQRGPPHMHRTYELAVDCICGRHADHAEVLTTAYGADRGEGERACASAVQVRWPYC